MLSIYLYIHIILKHTDVFCIAYNVCQDWFPLELVVRWSCISICILSGPRKWTRSWVFSSWYNAQGVFWIDLPFLMRLTCNGGSCCQFLSINGHPLLLHFVKVLIVLLLRSHMVLNFKQIIMNIICGPWTFAPLVVLVESVSLVRQHYAYVGFTKETWYPGTSRNSLELVWCWIST